jgi:hypothetical protein
MWIVLAIFTVAIVLFGTIWLLSPDYSDYLDSNFYDNLKDIDHLKVDDDEEYFSEGVMHDEY